MIEPFKPHPNLSTEINQQIEQSQIEGGADTRKLVVGNSLKVTTMNTTYILKRIAEGNKGYPFEISGHAIYCPTPRRGMLTGSTWGGSMLKMNYIGRGMHMEFYCEEPQGFRLLTSPVKEVEEIVG